MPRRPDAPPTAAPPKAVPVRAAPSAERRSQRSHEAVLRAAEALLSESGYASITVDQIAARAGVSKATIYRWWPDKAAIFMELYTLLGGTRIRQPADTGSLAGDLQAQIRAAFKLFRETVAGLALAGFVAEGQTNPEVAQRLRGPFAQHRRQLNKAVLQRAVERGEIAADTPLEIVSELITGAVYYAVLIGQTPYTDARADAIVRVLLDGVRGTRTTPAPQAPLRRSGSKAAARAAEPADR